MMHAKHVKSAVKSREMMSKRAMSHKMDAEMKPMMKMEQGMTKKCDEYHPVRKA